jgi:hypothetical protein
MDEEHFANVLKFGKLEVKKHDRFMTIGCDRD